MSTLAEIFKTLIRRLGPYLAIELLLPGGTLIALLLWAYRQRPMFHPPSVREPTVSSLPFVSAAASS
jgi:hypothetical protein